ncbi:FAD/NAD(P)-binding domain-containing protein [Wolfiporia cocos MD-104 SS10]|uniref:FAD/NAD(P)-binding domain-containing protein n=1 Tax=Wolfiporia cocos (strain MD-104) TaxID=742152 RepID=A0A2H3JFG1_WOLCO|nr:FAD/NAD(P)-binding domain-containing protein [Wolfiporia cocos MD-104 SS10]
MAPPPPAPAPLPLHILVVGCGLGGLAAAHTLSAAGHRVTLVESAPALGEVGAGIQVSPNVARLFARWGLAAALAAAAVEPAAIVLRRYSTGEHVGYTRLGRFADGFLGADTDAPDAAPGEWGDPYYNVHRADLHRMLYDLAAPHVELRLGAAVVDVDPAAPSVTLASGEVLRADVVVGADGVKSTVQRFVLGQTNPATATGDAVYRALIPAEHLLADPDLRGLVEHPEMTVWMGPQRHVVGYCIRNRELYNLVLAHPDDGSVESWTAEGSADTMRTQYADFEPRVRKLMTFVESTLKWRLMDRQPLPTWVHPAGSVVLLGDACHPMLPYRAQGAAMAFEDAAVLGRLFSHVSARAQIPHLLRAYEQLRHARASDTQASSRLNQRLFHLPDGPEQEARDAGMRRAAVGELKAVERARAEARAQMGEGSGPDGVDGVDGKGVNGKSHAEANGVSGGTNGVRGVNGVNGANGTNGTNGTAHTLETDGEDGDEEESTEGNPNQWADKRKTGTQFGYDADEEAERWWAEVGVRTVAPLVDGVSG